MTEKTTHAYLVADELVLEDFRERDPDVVTLVSGAADLDEAVHRCLAMGARVLLTAGASLDSELVEHRFDAMAGELDRKILDFAARVDKSAKDLLDDEQGELRVWIEEITQLLGDTFDAKSTESVIAKLRTVLDEARGEQVHAVRQLLDPEQDGSPLASWRSEIVKELREQRTAMEGALRDLTQHLAVEAARSEVNEKTAIKGRQFELVVLERLGPIATIHEDVPEYVGDAVGSQGTKVGDIVVSIDPVATPGRTVRYVVEAKDTHRPLKGALDELAKAMTNRDAQAGLMVFAGQGLCPVKEPFQWFDHRAVVVLDKSDLDAHALRLGCHWARWTACREAHEEHGAIDPVRVHALLDAARLSLKTTTTIRGSHTKAKTAIDQATAQLDALVEGLKVTLDELEQELREQGASVAPQEGASKPPEPSIGSISRQGSAVGEPPRAANRGS